jgi:hypothetical protein
VTTKRRRFRLKPKGGVECFEVRLVTSIKPDGTIVTLTEVTTPDSIDEPNVGDVLEALRQARRSVIEAYEGDE